MKPDITTINRNFVIRYSFPGIPGTNLIGAGQYHRLVGEKLKIKHFDRALNSGQRVTTFKIRKRLYVDFHAK